MSNYQITKTIGIITKYQGDPMAESNAISALKTLKDSYVAQGAVIQIDEEMNFTMVFQKNIVKFALAEVI